MKNKKDKVSMKQIDIFTRYREEGGSFVLEDYSHPHESICIIVNHKDCDYLSYFREFKDTKGNVANVNRIALEATSVNDYESLISKYNIEVSGGASYFSKVIENIHNLYSDIKERLRYYQLVRGRERLTKRKNIPHDLKEGLDLLVTELIFRFEALEDIVQYRQSLTTQTCSVNPFLEEFYSDTELRERVVRAILRYIKDKD